MSEELLSAINQLIEELRETQRRRQSTMLVVVPPERRERARHEFPDAMVLTPGAAPPPGSSFHAVLLDVNMDDASIRTWVMEYLYCRLVPGGAVFEIEPARL